MKKIILFILVVFAALQIAGTAGAVITVGRISHVEGEIFRLMDVDDSWVTTFLQSPVGTQDVLMTGDSSRAEIIFPNNQLLRLEQNTEIEILNMEGDSGEFSLQSGLARFYNKSSAGGMIVETARGTVKVAPESSVDVLADKESITVSAVYGEATFHTFQDGIERMEVISGSTTLEFQEKSIIAGVGPLDRKWDRWCAAREGVLTRNRLVRSEHLPESMQEYAYVMEPYGHWQKIYYRGYYYWAWEPQSVPAGWSPYTTGYWYDWHGSEVWMDYNPWGWVTHHHGHWLNLHGAWLWTPYVHVSHVPGVAVIGFNITFGKGYRSHWHPGRVRWITYNDYIGWLPLAPWETYYGYRKWGPRTVVVQRGSIFSVNINLSRHRHIDHAVVIDKRYLHHRKPGTINNYKTVRVRNLNKRTILNNYRPLSTAQRLREVKNSTKVTRTRAGVRRIEGRPVKRTEKVRKVFRNEKSEGIKDRALLFQHNRQKERIGQAKTENVRKPAVRRERSTVTVRNKRVDERKLSKSLPNGSRVQGERKQHSAQKAPEGSWNSIRNEKTVAVKHKKDGGRKIERKNFPTPVVTENKVLRKTRGKVVRTEKSSRKRTVTKSSGNIVKKGVAVRDNARKSFMNKAGSKKRSEKTVQAETKTPRRPTVRQERKTVAGGNKRVAARSLRKTPARVSRMQEERKLNSAQKVPEGNRNHRNVENKEDTNHRQFVRGSHNSSERMASWGKGQYEKRSGRSR